MCRFIFELSSKERIITYRSFWQDPVIYNEDNGSITESKMEFIIVNSYEKTDYEEAHTNFNNYKRYVMTKDTLPKRVWYQLANGKQIEIEW